MEKREIELVKEFLGGALVLILGTAAFWLFLHVYVAMTGHYLDFGGNRNG